MSASRHENAFLAKVRAIPGLTGAAAIIGLIVFSFIVLRSFDRVAASANIVDHLKYAAVDGTKEEMLTDLMGTLWQKGALCFLPALILAVIRQRGIHFTIPLFCICTWVAAYVLGRELLSNLENTYRDPLGMMPSIGTYWTKVGLMMALFMSPPLVWWVYHKSSLLDRYLVRSLLVPLLLCIAAITGIKVTMDLLNNAKDFAEAGLSTSEVISFYVFQVPRMLVFTCEAALLLAVLFCLSKLSRHNEMVSMISSGRSLLRILLPIFAVGLWFSLAVLALNYQLAPEADRIQADLLQSAKSRDQSSRKRGDEAPAAYNVMFRNRIDHRTWYLHKVPAHLKERPGGKISEVYVVEENAQGEIDRVLMAKSAFWAPVSKIWKFFHVRLYDFIDRKANGTRIANPQPQIVDRMDIMDPLWRETPGTILSDRRDPEFMGVPELRSFLQTNADFPAATLADYRVTEHWRYALPLRCLLVVLFAAPLGIMATRRNMLGGVTLAVSIFIAINLGSSLLLTFGKGGHLSPGVSAWIMNGVTAVIALLILLSRSQYRLFGIFKRHPTAPVRVASVA
jgi:lipopolysaccharide export system permease protein